jgi:hypothetical protein
VIVVVIAATAAVVGVGVGVADTLCPLVVDSSNRLFYIV